MLFGWAGGSLRIFRPAPREPFVNHIVPVAWGSFARCGWDPVNEQASFPTWPMTEPKAPPDDIVEDERAALYRQSARTLRQLAAEVRFDFCRREQLLALAAGFDRFADRVEQAPLKRAAD